MSQASEPAVMSQYAHLATIDPEFAQALSQIPQQPEAKDLQEIRQSAKNQAKKVSFPESQLKIKDWTVPVSGAEIDVRSYAPPSDGAGNPLLFWMHGGGFAVGGLHTNDAMLQQLAVNLKISILNVDYRLAPEHPFPTGLNDSWEALKWASTRAGDFQADLKKGFLIGGASSGGQFTAVLAHRARDDPTFTAKITGEISQVPTLVNHNGVPEKYKAELFSYEQNKDVPLFGIAQMHYFAKMYGAKDPTDPDSSPVLFPSHKNLPPLYLQVCGLDFLRDDGFLYERLLREAGVKTKMDVYPGVPHGFHLALPQLSQSVKFQEDTRKGIKWLLGFSV